MTKLAMCSFEMAAIVIASLHAVDILTLGGDRGIQARSDQAYDRLARTCSEALARSQSWTGARVCTPTNLKIPLARRRAR
jgi:hypothetical protein